MVSVQAHFRRAKVKRSVPELELPAGGWFGAGAWGAAAVHGRYRRFAAV